MDYFAMKKRRDAIYQDFKFRVIAAFAPNREWTLTGRQIENAFIRITDKER
jgi:hypothetical protein